MATSWYTRQFLIMWKDFGAWCFKVAFSHLRSPRLNIKFLFIYRCSGWQFAQVKNRSPWRCAICWLISFKTIYWFIATNLKWTRNKPVYLIIVWLLLTYSKYCLPPFISLISLDKIHTSFPCTFVTQREILCYFNSMNLIQQGCMHGYRIH